MRAWDDQLLARLTAHLFPVRSSECAEWKDRQRVSASRRVSSGVELRVVDDVPGPGAVARVVLDPDRTAAVRATGLLDSAPEVVFDDLVEVARTVTGAQYAAFTVHAADRSWRKSACGPGIPAGKQDGLCWSVAAADGPLVVPNVADEPQVCQVAATWGIEALAAVPVRGPGDWMVGTLWVGDLTPRPWGAAQVQALRVIARSIGSEVRLRAHEDADRARQAHPCGVPTIDEAVRALQSSLLPAVLPSVPQADIAVGHRSAGRAAPAGGDFYDLFAVGNYWCAVVGDVAARGIDAARLMALARYTIRTEATHGPDPRRVLEQLHRALLADGGDTFVTATVAMLRPDDRGGLIGTLSSGGHEPVLVRRTTGAVEVVEPQGVLLGVMPRPMPPAELLHLAPGDLLMLYTNGVTTARPGPGHECYGDRRLAALVESCPTGTGAQILVDRVLRAVTTHEAGHGHDDAAVLAVRALPATDLGRP